MSLNDIRARAAKGIKGDVAEPFVPEAHGVKRPMSSPGAMAMLSPELDRLRDRNTELQASYGKPLQLRLDSLVSPVGRRRSLSDEQFAELTENLRRNPLITPITVRAIEDHKFEVVSGNNRVAAYRDLGRTEIEGFIKEFEPNTEDRAAFFANLLQPSLSSFERYLGFKAELERTGLTQREISKQAGVSESNVSDLLAFDQLPAELIAILRTQVQALSAKGARLFIGAIEQGCDVAVAEAALNALARSEITEKEAVKRIRSNLSVGKKSVDLVRRTMYRAGNADRCEMVCRNSEIRLSFKVDADRQWIEAEVERLLRQRYSTKAK